MLYLCRHGQTEWCLSGQHTSTTDLDLTPEGEKEALLLKERLSIEPVGKIYSSPMKRALQTCSGLRVEKEPLAVEWNYGDYEGLSTWQIQQKRADWNLFVDGAPNGEVAADVATRADQFLQKLDPNENVALFSHGHFLRVLAARFLGLEPEDGALLSLAPASLSILGFERGAPVITLWNEVSHLRGLAKSQT